jgi:hypothetical protein
MQRNFSVILMFACVVAFVLGVAELFKLRFETGDVYPAYSSLRSDPLGASAFYESLERVPGITVSRDFRASDELPEGRNTAYLQLAGERYDWTEMPQALFKEVDGFVRGGGRLVIAFFPETTKPSGPTSFTPAKSKNKSFKIKPENKDDKDDGDKARDKEKEKKKLSGEEDEWSRVVSLKEKWGVEFGFTALKTEESGDKYETLSVTNEDEPSLPASIAWHSGMVFKRPDKNWRIIYARDADAVLMERKFGTGSVVLASDSFFLSNEALEKDRHAELLAWVIGPSHQVMFDEAHLGIVDNPGVATLVRKYRLHGLVAGLLLLAGLFIWKNSVSFVPALPEEESATHVIGKDSAAGFVNLLRRHIPAKDVLAICLTEWKKSFPKGKVPTARLERAQKVIDAENALGTVRHPVQTYQAICKALKETGTPH